jgi:hypothetical protein
MYNSYIILTKGSILTSQNIEKELDAYELTAMSYFGLSSISGFNTLNLLKNIPELDRIEVGVFFGMALVEVNDQCIDNYRVFSKNDTDKYNEIQSQGCCGFYDSEITCGSGVTYLIGFNYGH